VVLGGGAVSYERGTPAPEEDSAAFRSGGTGRARGHMFSHRMYLFICCSKSTPPKNRQLIISSLTYSGPEPPWANGARPPQEPRPSELGTYTTVTARLWPWLPGSRTKTPQVVPSLLGRVTKKDGAISGRRHVQCSYTTWHP